MQMYSFISNCLILRIEKSESGKFYEELIFLSLLNVIFKIDSIANTFNRKILCVTIRKMSKSTQEPRS